MRSPTLLRSLVVACLVVATPALAKKKPKPPKGPNPNEAAINQVIETVNDKIAQCVLDATPATDDWKIKLSASIMINDTGQVMACNVSATPSGPMGDKARSCVEALLKHTPFPKSKESLTQITRTWQFSAH